MLRDIFKCNYIPTLCVRPAEMRALEELPETDKDLLFPFILLSPWVGSNELKSSIDRLEKSYGSRTFILGIDRYYNHQSPKRQAQFDIISMLKGEDNFKEYYDFASDIEQAIPCAFLREDNYACLEIQIDRCLALGRGVVLSIDKNRSVISNNLTSLISQYDPKDIAVHIDGGWSKNEQIDALWYINVCKSIYSQNEKCAIVVSCSSFPKGFDNVEGVIDIPIGSRQLFNEVSGNFNNETIIYGDWASTKPRSDERGSQPRPRIDYALHDKWVISRKWTLGSKDNWDYDDAANNLIESEFWPSSINVWGEMRIQQTALGMAFSIENAPANVAARINVHLHQQTNFGGVIISTDDVWED
ncbi:MAG: beta family protein [Rhizobiaceae bacterium]|nr:beta family protein [Rhizobiaceae bacterium]